MIRISPEPKGQKLDRLNFVANCFLDFISIVQFHIKNGTSNNRNDWLATK